MSGRPAAIKRHRQEASENAIQAQNRVAKGKAGRRREWFKGRDGLMHYFRHGARVR